MRFLLTLLLFSTSFAYAQKTMHVVDRATRENIPFARINPEGGNAFLADLDGYFILPEGISAFRVQAFSYSDTLINTATTDSLILMTPAASELEEFVLLPGVNPAERIMEAAIANRKKNHPMGNESFVYDTYSKFVFTMDQDAISSIPDTTTDSNLLDLKSFFGRSHLFMMESTSKKYFDPPYREKEVISAYKVSGFSDPAFSTFANEMQTFNFYENQFEVLGHTYINPLAFGSIRRYLFILEDSVINGTDTTYTIQFRPRKDKNFDGMKGYLYINTNGFALEKVIAEPAEPSQLIQPKIVQEYRLVDGKKWFPVKLSTDAVFPGARLDGGLENSYLVGKGTTYIENVQLGADVSKQKFNAVAVQVGDDAGEKDSTHWDERRQYQLTDKERATYVVADSLSKLENFDGKLEMLRAIADGKMPLGYVQADLKRFLDYRDYEGVRLGLGLETSRKTWKRGTVGGYFGYGFRDKAWKYGGYANATLVKSIFLKAEASIQSDLVERGGTNFITQVQSFNFDDLYKHLYVNRMEKQEKMELALSAYVFPNLKVLGFVNRQRIKFTQDYSYSSPSGAVIPANSGFNLQEVGGEIVWTFREKWMYLGEKRVMKKSKWPMLTARVTQRLPGYGTEDFGDYTRVNLQFKQSLDIRAVGKFTYQVSAGKTYGDVPLFLLHNANGTGANWNVSVPNTFESMSASSFFNREQVALFTRFTFKKMKTRLSWFMPEIVLHHGVGYGSFADRFRHSGDFRSMDKGYYEGGMMLNNLIDLKFMGLGIGAFYNYGHYSMPRVQDNITLKLGVSVNVF